MRRRLAPSLLALAFVQGCAFVPAMWGARSRGPGGQNPQAVVYDRSPRRVAPPVAPVAAQSARAPRREGRERRRPYEHRAYSLDAGLRFYSSHTGAYTVRFRIARPLLVMDLRYATIRLTGLEENDSVKLRVAAYALGVRHAFRIGSTYLALAVLGDFGVTAARGETSGDATTRIDGGGTVGLRGDVEYVVPVGMLRLRLGLEGGVERGFVPLAADSFGRVARLGGMHGWFGGFYLGVGLGQRNRDPS